MAPYKRWPLARHEAEEALRLEDINTDPCIMHAHPSCTQCVAQTARLSA